MPTRGGWSRYPVQLAGIRISDALSDAIRSHAATRQMRVSDYVRDALMRECGLDGAQSATHIDAETA